MFVVAGFTGSVGAVVVAACKHSLPLRRIERAEHERSKSLGNARRRHCPTLTVSLPYLYPGVLQSCSQH